MRYPTAPTAQNLPSSCQLRTERSDAHARRRCVESGAAGRATVASESSASGTSGCGDIFDSHAGGLDLAHGAVLLHHERGDGSVRRDEEIAQYPELVLRVRDGPAEKCPQ